MEKEYILLLDSGLGGVDLLNKCKALMPNENFLYIADTKNSPYGNKRKNRLNKLILKTLKLYCYKYKIKLIVFACNTATAVSISYIRQHIKIPIVGIEPAIKPALKKGGNILLLSTVATLKYNKNIVKFKKQKPKNITFLGLKKLAKLIDNNLVNLNNLKPYVNKKFAKYKPKNIEAIVLGCTHYIYLKNMFKSAIGNVNFYEATTPVARRVKYLLEKQNKLKTTGEGKTKLIVTNGNKTLKNQLLNYVK